jgi:fumarylacetoacetase
MDYTIDPTHDRALESWVAGANGHPDFPIQNLPLCIFSPGAAKPRGGVRIGDYILDLAALIESDLIAPDQRRIVEVATAPTLNAFFALPQPDRLAFRAAISALLSRANDAAANRSGDLLVPVDDVTFHLPAQVGDYSDFFAGIHHARTAGAMFRPENPLLPNYKHVPIAYHGRSSSVRVSGHPVVHPIGQRAPHGATAPEFGESRRLDFELEMAIWISGGNPIGSPIPIGQAADHIVGFGLLNDWSARDIQAWETQPLGPFLGKNFLTTVSPYVVMTEALAPYRVALPPRAPEDPEPLPYLLDTQDQSQGAFNIQLEVHILTPLMREKGIAPQRLTRSSGLDLYWTPAQMVAHHTATGCDLRPGDLFGTGTISAAGSQGHGSMLELTSAGRNPVSLSSGETRTFLEDGDEIIMTGWAERDGFARIGLGEARGTVHANPASVSSKLERAHP